MKDNVRIITYLSENQLQNMLIIRLTAPAVLLERGGNLRYTKQGGGGASIKYHP